MSGSITKLKVLHLPSYVGNHGYNLALVERRQGINSKSLGIGVNKFGFNSDIIVKLSSNKVVNVSQLFNLFRKIYKCYDVYHFNFGQSIIDFPGRNIDLLDLPFYQGRKFMTFNGSDLRQLVVPEINPYFNSQNGFMKINSEKKIRKRVDKIVKNVDHCFVVNPDLMRFLPQDVCSFIPYIKATWFNIKKKSAVFLDKTTTIVHAPTDRKIKGTDFIVNAVENLKRRHSIEFILIENLSQEEALKIYARADLVIDQVRLGWYGAFALESMKMGIPVAVYINENDLVYVPHDMRVALGESVINVNPDTIEEKLDNILGDRMALNRMGEKGYEYVNEFHDPDKLIKMVIDHYQLD